MTTEEFNKKFHLKTTKGFAIERLFHKPDTPGLYLSRVITGDDPRVWNLAQFNGFGHFVGWLGAPSIWSRPGRPSPGDLVPRETKQESKSFTACMKPGVPCDVLGATPFRVFNQHSVLGGRRITELTWNEDKPTELLGKLEGHVGFTFIWNAQGAVSGIIRGGRPAAFRDVALYNLKPRMIVTPTLRVTSYQEAVAAVFGAPPKPVPLLEPVTPDEAKHALNVLLNHTAKPVRNQLRDEIALLRRFIREAKEGEES